MVCPRSLASCEVRLEVFLGKANAEFRELQVLSQGRTISTMEEVHGCVLPPFWFCLNGTQQRTPLVSTSCAQPASRRPGS